MRYGRTDARTDGRTDNLKTVYPLQTKFAGGGINISLLKYIVGPESKPCNSDFYQNDFLSMQEYHLGAHFTEIRFFAMKKMLKMS